MGQKRCVIREVNISLQAEQQLRERETKDEAFRETHDQEITLDFLKDTMLHATLIKKAGHQVRRHSPPPPPPPKHPPIPIPPSS